MGAVAESDADGSSNFNAAPGYAVGEVAGPNQNNAGPVDKAEMPEGFPFGPDSAVRRLTDPSLAFFYVAIAGLTVMNDKIAAAVDAHSSVRRVPMQRLFDTANAAVTLVFGEEDQALAKASELWHFHNTVQGHSQNVEYSANDGRLQAWVLACIFKGSEEAARRWARPFTPDQRTALYEDIRTFGQVFGVPEQFIPPTVEDLDAFWEAALDDEGVGQGFLLQEPVSQDMARMAFRLEGLHMRGFARHIGRAVLTMSLDPRLQKRADIHPTFSDRLLSGAFDAFMAVMYKWWPQRARESVIPLYLKARRSAAGRTLGRLALGVASRILLEDEAVAG